MSPLHAIAFAIGLLVGAATSGCGTLPAAAYPAPAGELDRVHAAWVAAGNPPCLPLPTLYVYEATTAERVDWCNSDPPPDACLTTPRTGMMRQVYMAVVLPEWPQAFRHEANHMLEACTLGGYDYAHSGPQWSDTARRQAGIP